MREIFTTGESRSRAIIMAGLGRPTGRRGRRETTPRRRMNGRLSAATR
jgi:hypothetical protein